MRLQMCYKQYVEHPHVKSQWVKALQVWKMQQSLQVQRPSETSYQRLSQRRKCIHLQAHLNVLPSEILTGTCYATVKKCLLQDEPWLSIPLLETQTLKEPICVWVVFRCSKNQISWLTPTLPFTTCGTRGSGRIGSCSTANLTLSAILPKNIWIYL